MPATFGRTNLGKTGRTVRCIADGDYSRAKSGGITLDTSVLTAVSGSAVTLLGDTVVAVGSVYLRFGQVMTMITATGKYGPYDPAASDGRQLLNRGQCFVLDETWVDQPTVNGVGLGTAHPCVFDGGRVWKDRILQVGTGTASLAAGPTLANFLAAFPEIGFVGS